MFRRIFTLGASAAALSCFALAGVAQAEPTQYSGTVPNGGCDVARNITVSGPSRIDAEVSSTAAERAAYILISTPSGQTYQTGSYDTTSGGLFTVRVCTYWDTQNTPNMQYHLIYATGPAGQAALPHQQGQVLGETTTISHGVRGTAALSTRKGLAWFKVNLGTTGLATVRVYNPLTKTHMLFTRAKVSYGLNIVRISKGTMHLTLVKGARREVVGFRSPHFKISGKVVRGNFIII